MPTGVYIRTKEAKEAMSKGQTGRILSSDVREKISMALKGKSKSLEHKVSLQIAAKNKFRNGFIHPLKGKHSKRTGILNNMWKGGVSKINKTERQLFMQTIEYKEWRNCVFKRDDYTCQICNRRGVSIEADHIKKYSDYPELRLSVDNGRTLCKECHSKTDTYGCLVRNELGQFSICS